MKKYLKAFTLMEVLITAILIGVIAAFAIPTYKKAYRKQTERSAVLQLINIHAGLEIYKAKNGYYMDDPVGDLCDEDQIAATLGITIQHEANENYCYSQSGVPATGYDVWYVHAGSDYFEFTLKNAPIVSGVNPCCRFGACPSLPNC